MLEDILNRATIGELAHAIQQRLSINTEIKIKAGWIRVQHTQNCDRLGSAASVDRALSMNAYKC